VLAEDVVRLAGVEPVLAEIAFAREQLERGRLDDRAPPAVLGAIRAVAAAGTGLQVDLGLEADGAAMAAAVMGLEHGESLSELMFEAPL